MREIFTLVFLTLSYNFILWVITKSELIPVRLFPDDILTGVLLLSFNTALFLSWVFGERRRSVVWITALFLIQTVGLAIMLGDYTVITEILTPLTLTYSFVILFESPTEKRLKALIKENEFLLEELERNRRGLQGLQVSIAENKQIMDKLMREKAGLETRLRNMNLTSAEKEKLETEKRELESKIEDYNAQLETLKEKERKLVEANRKLFSLLEALREGDESPGGRERELSSLRRERKKLLKEIFELQDLLDFYADENQKLSEENRRLKQKLEEKSRELIKSKVSVENLSREVKKVVDVYADILRLMFKSFEFTDRAVEEFIRLDVDRKRNLLRELLNIELGLKEIPYEPLANNKDVFKLKFNGGRAYFSRESGRMLILGILGSEEDKEKHRYIEELLRGFRSQGVSG